MNQPVYLNTFSFRVKRISPGHSTIVADIAENPYPDPETALILTKPMGISRCLMYRAHTMTIYGYLSLIDMLTYGIDNRIQRNKKHSRINSKNDAISRQTAIVK